MEHPNICNHTRESLYEDICTFSRLKHPKKDQPLADKVRKYIHALIIYDNNYMPPSVDTAPILTVKKVFNDFLTAHPRYLKHPIILLAMNNVGKRYSTIHNHRRREKIAKLNIEERDRKLASSNNLGKTPPLPPLPPINKVMTATESSTSTVAMAETDTQIHSRLVGQRKNRHNDIIEQFYGAEIGGDTTMTNLTLGNGSNGKINVICNMLGLRQQQTIAKEIENYAQYRQYSIQGSDEPRTHILLSSNVTNGYQYHGVRMKAQDINACPNIARLANDLANEYNIDEWNIGVDVIIYKDGQDSIGWHADDTQNETIILALIIKSQTTRTVQIKSNDETEHIDLFLGAGDAYIMDGETQRTHQHRVPKSPRETAARYVLIFRHGVKQGVKKDSGRLVEVNCEGEIIDAINQTRMKRYICVFGHVQLIMEGECYSRISLKENNGHGQLQSGVSGNINVGADAIIVSRQSVELNEEDGLIWLHYTSTRRQGGGALCVSFRENLPIRVFRSSKLKGKYKASSKNKTAYRYDGLYKVVQVWNGKGSTTKDMIPVSPKNTPNDKHEAYTFRLVRMKEGNTLSIDDLWERIQRSRHTTSTKPFESNPPKILKLAKLQ